MRKVAIVAAFGLLTAACGGLWGLVSHARLRLFPIGYEFRPPADDRSH
jgi:hypothetical protein